jgi:hypothetical protein
MKTAALGYWPLALGLCLLAFFLGLSSWLISRVPISL